MSRSRHTILLVVFIVFAIISFFYSPWEDGAKLFFEEVQGIQFTLRTHENDPTFFVLLRIILFGIADSIELLGYSMYAIKELPDMAEFWAYIMPALAATIWYIGQVVMNHVNSFYEDEIVYDSLWEKIFDLFCFENIFSYLLSLIVFFLVNVLSRQISIFTSSHETISLLIEIILFLLCVGVMFSIAVFYFIYFLVIMIPIGIFAVLGPNNAIGVGLCLACEVIFIAVIWRSFIADYVIKLSLYIALFPIRFIKGLFS